MHSYKQNMHSITSVLWSQALVYEQEYKKCQNYLYTLKHRNFMFLFIHFVCQSHFMPYHMPHLSKVTPQKAINCAYLWNPLTKNLKGERMWVTKVRFKGVKRDLWLFHVVSWYCDISSGTLYSTEESIFKFREHDGMHALFTIFISF